MRGSNYQFFNERALRCDGQPFTRSVQVVSRLTGLSRTRPWLIPLRGYVHLSPCLVSPRAKRMRTYIFMFPRGYNVTCFFRARATARHKERKEKNDTTSFEIESVMPTERCWSKSYRSVLTLNIWDVSHFTFHWSCFLFNALFYGHSKKK